MSAQRGGEGRRSVADVLQALVTLGRAREDQIASATLGLTELMQGEARDASTALRFVAARLVSRKLAAEVRAEVAALLATSTYPSDAALADWSSPHAIPVGEGDIFPLLLFHSRDEPLGCSGYEGDDDWPVRQDFHYRFATHLAQVNQAWRRRVREWCEEACCFSMLGGCDSDRSMLASFVRLSGPSAVELHLHGA